MDNIKFKDFQTMCRTCMSTCDLIYIQDNNKLDILQFLTGTRYSESDELPHQLCLKCNQTMNDIHSFKFRCQQTHLSLTKCLTEFKNNEDTLFTNNAEENFNKIEFISIKQEIEDDIINEELVTGHLVKEELLFEQIAVKEDIKDEEPSISADKNSFVSKPHGDSHETSEEITNEIQQSHERRYICDICNKRFANKSYLVTHKITHSDERPFECNICSKDFKHVSHLIQHKKIHSGERPHRCAICSKTFSQKHNLERHKAIHSNERRFECDVCMKCFKYSNNLIVHKRIHSSERPFQCDVCNKTFTSKSTLVTHKESHNDDCRFKCDVCMKGFKHSSHLIRHKRIHNGEY